MGKCYNSTVVDASRDEVWQKIRDFHDLEWVAPVITKLEVIGDKAGTEVGASRLLNDAFKETLVAIDEEGYTFDYSIDDAPAPLDADSVKSYIGTVKLYSVTDTNQTFVEWISVYETKDDQAVAEFCNPIYGALLEAMKAYFKQ